MSNISANIFPFFAPFTDFDLHTLENQPESMDIIYSRIRDLIATSGNSALLPITDKPSIASVKAAEAIQASKNEYLTKQFEQFFNNTINSNFGLKNVWKINLWGDIFYWRDDMKNTKELVFSGLEGLLPKLLSSQELSPEDYKGSVIYLDALGIKIEKSMDREKFEFDKKVGMMTAKAQVQAKKTSTSSTNPTSSNSDGSSNPVGRPKLADTDIENDNTGISANTGNNVSEIKYSLNEDFNSFNSDNNLDNSSETNGELFDDETASLINTFGSYLNELNEPYEDLNEEELEQMNEIVNEILDNE